MHVRVVARAAIVIAGGRGGRGGHGDTGEGGSGGIACSATVVDAHVDTATKLVM